MEIGIPPPSNADPSARPGVVSAMDQAARGGVNADLPPPEEPGATPESPPSGTGRELGATGADSTVSRSMFRGWKVAGAGAVIQALHSALIIQAFGNYAVLLREQFGWSKTTISVAYSFNRAESGLLGPIQGWTLDRFGSRAVMRVGAVILAVGFALFSQVQTPVQFISAFMVLSVGAGLSGFLTVTTTTVRWFERQRSRALAVISVGFALGGLSTPAVVWGLRSLGWRTMALSSGIAICLVTLAVSSLFAGGPEDHGQRVDGRPDDVEGDGAWRRSATAGSHHTAGEALRTRAFWMLALGHASALLVVGSVIAHLSLYLTSEQGFGLQEASFVAGALPLVQLMGTVLGGVLGDRVDKRLLASLAMLGHMGGLLLLTFATGRWMIWLFVVLHGLSWGIRGPIMQALRADYFGATAFGQIMGYSSIILMIGIVGGPLFAGLLADVTGSYRLGFTILAVLAGAGLSFFAMATPPGPPAERSGPSRR